MTAFAMVSAAAMKLRPSVFDTLDERVFSEFSSKIHPSNRLTSARESETCPAHFCRIHDDRSTNSREMTAVFGVSVIRNGVRHSFNAQHKNSIDAYCHRVEESRDLMQRIESFVDTCKPSRKGLSQALFRVCGRYTMHRQPSQFGPIILQPDKYG